MLVVNRPDKICTQCGMVNKGVRKHPGNSALELLIWGAGIIGGLMIALPLFFLVLVGLCYTMWRSTNEYRVCSSCGHSGMVGLDTPVGKKLQEQYVDRQGGGKN